MDSRSDGFGSSREKVVAFGFDYCYWSVNPEDPQYASQDVVMSCFFYSSQFFHNYILIGKLAWNLGSDYFLLIIVWSETNGV